MAIDILFPNHDKLVSTFIQFVCFAGCVFVFVCGMRPFVRYRKIMRMLYLCYREWDSKWNWNIFFYNIDTFAIVFPCICWWFCGAARRRRRRFGSFSSWEYRTFAITNPLLSKRGSSPMSFCTATGTNKPICQEYTCTHRWSRCEAYASDNQTDEDEDGFLFRCLFRVISSIILHSFEKFTYRFIPFFSFAFFFCSTLLLMRLLLGCRLWLIGSMKEIKAIYFGCVHVCDSRLCIHCLFAHSTDNVFIFLFLGYLFLLLLSFLSIARSH